MRLISFLFASAIAAIAPLHACSVPVFRYALEHWPPDPFQAMVFHRGPLSEEQGTVVRDLGAEGLAGSLRANISLQIVDLDANPSPEMRGLARTEVTGVLPWVVVKMPRAAKSGATVWSGPLSADAVRQLLESPARQEIVGRLGAGQSAVWVLIESGDAAKDSAAAKVLEDRLAELASTLALPQLEASDIANGLVSVAQGDLRLHFSVLRLARSDAAERSFLQMLLATERDLAETRDPIAIPIFGRGRALYAFVGAGIQRETIDQAAKFLIGKCSCQVKEMNPGADLLFAADWDALVKAHAPAAPDLPTLAGLARSAPETVVFGGDMAQPDAAPALRARFVPDSVLLSIAAFGVLLAVCGLWRLIRR